jgi:hypothetical protein
MRCVRAEDNILHLIVICEVSICKIYKVILELLSSYYLELEDTEGTLEVLVDCDSIG